MRFHLKGSFKVDQKKNPVDFFLTHAVLCSYLLPRGDFVLVKLAVLVTSYVRKYKFSVYFIFLWPNNSGLGRLIFLGFFVTHN